MAEPAPVDHKDTPGEYRQQVRELVFRRVGSRGEPVTSPHKLVGVWDVAFVGLNPSDLKPLVVYSLAKDGTATIQVVGQPDLTSSDQWRLNSDGTFSILTWCPPNPRFGIIEPQLDEDRRHIAALPTGQLVAWDGDGGSLYLFSPRQRKTAPSSQRKTGKTKPGPDGKL